MLCNAMQNRMINPILSYPGHTVIEPSCHLESQGCGGCRAASGRNCALHPGEQPHSGL